MDIDTKTPSTMLYMDVKTIIKIGASTAYAEAAGCKDAVVPAVNQVETHVFDQQLEPQGIMEEFGTHIMSWAPLAEGRNNFFHNPTLAAIAASHGKSVAQVALRWLVQRGVIIIPKSTHVERMRENLDIFGFTLTADEMQQIAKLDTGRSLFFDHHAADVTRMFMGWR